MSTKYIEQNAKKIYDEISKEWDDSIIPELIEYIKIPNKSVHFDPDWKKHGYMDKAMQLIKTWCEKQPIQGMKIDLLELEGRTPLLFIEIPGQTDETVLLYGHMDKQPEMKGWDPDLGPWKPVLKDDKLYGRGGADDGYSIFASLAAIATLQRHNIPHARCVVIIEGCEESGSADLPFYLEKLKDRIGHPNLVICLDTGCGNYEQMWGSTSLRGLVAGKLTIEMLKNGIHSGLGSGVVPSTFTILRQLLNRIEDPETGKVTLKDLIVDIPKQRIDQARQTAETLHDIYFDTFPFLKDVKPITDDIAELLLNQTWRPQLSVIGLDGLPSTANAGNVTVPSLSVGISIRIPPTCDAEQAVNALKKELESDPPFNAKITFEPDTPATGWEAPELEDWLENANNTASMLFYNKPAAYFGEGGTIPFMGMLGEMYPKAQFLITGVLGPKSNAHGPNEFLHIPMGKKITACVTSVLSAHYEQFK